MDIKVPEVGESVFEALVAKWHKQDGERVAKDEPVCEIETDKITLEINADAAGVVRIKVAEGTTVKVGAVIGEIDEQAVEAPQAPAAEEKRPAREPQVSPAARKLAREQGKEPGTGDRGPATAGELQQKQAEVEKPLEAPAVRSEEPAPYLPAASQEERVTRKRLTPIRKRIAERLLAARQQTAMLTSFNEADHGRITDLRRKYGEQFQHRHGVKLGFMPFFVKACCEALAEFPVVNARIDGDDIVYHNFYDIGIAYRRRKGAGGA